MSGVSKTGSAVTGSAAIKNQRPSDDAVPTRGSRYINAFVDSEGRANYYFPSGETFVTGTGAELARDLGAVYRAVRNSR